ncbi:adenosylcobyric acid synthase (glutamine-hydrolysing) [Peptoclostridium litorale DSM 5388]|uniref:Cobyric acid synthase n=1 Tax=Peptoclostridium litorale DSM 5388 TaxID=1121324 RepID=A0A069RHJ4_PEPLI|nr:cobyric acid synthase [Peptoclostridium litorale]KDR96504.1 cobyric acid synthase CbiP [Peptoclostridium litorale DSM 5388]SIN69822.1 adenosylcobyric acid synthase (glutamine-hydrolysing) [Peptoclostridium litorale DSM 5388]
MSKSIMFQGTGSTVGKSILTAALCRILSQDGYRVAPFKAQNMALNSYITKDGGEMGRAQVVQAEAAGIEPHVDMNPVLLKPTSTMGSQIIVHGRVHSNMKAGEYYQKKTVMKTAVMEAYNRLSSKYDVIVLEGAGSPAEINLRKNDIVNMGMAEMSDSPVILIGDIDKGGVFAQIYGTVMLLEPQERKRIRGYIINKFRGDVELLKPGIEMFRERLDIPCLGVINHMDINIEDEDSVSTRIRSDVHGDVVIGVVRLPYMSNFTDFTPFEAQEGVAVRYASKPHELEDVDMVIIPGSKNTISDMKFIFESGMDKAIYALHRKGVPVIGICGGYQMLGMEIRDPHRVESDMERINGLSLLDISTTMAAEKRTSQIGAKIISGTGMLGGSIGQAAGGYEIHMGRSDALEGTIRPIELEDGRLEGAVSPDGSVFGTYIHGIFENDGFRSSIVDLLREKKGMGKMEVTLSYAQMKEMEYDKLAKAVRESLDMDKIMDIIGV